MKKNVLIALAVAAALGIAYFLYKKGQTAQIENKAAALPAADPQDEADFKALVQIFQSKAKNPKDAAWIIDGMADFLNGQRTIEATGLVNGKVTKSAAFYSSWATGYYGKNQDNVALSDAMWDKFQNIRLRSQGVSI